MGCNSSTSRLPPVASIEKAVHDDLFDAMCAADHHRRAIHGSCTQREERRYWIMFVIDTGRLRRIQENHQLSDAEVKDYSIVVMIEYEKTRKWWSDLKRKHGVNRHSH